MRSGCWCRLPPRAPSASGGRRPSPAPSAATATQVTRVQLGLFGWRLGVLYAVADALRYCCVRWLAARLLHLSGTHPTVVAAARRIPHPSMFLCLCSAGWAVQQAGRVWCPLAPAAVPVPQKDAALQVSWPKLDTAAVLLLHQTGVCLTVACAASRCAVLCGTCSWLGELSPSLRTLLFCPSPSPLCVQELPRLQAAAGRDAAVHRRFRFRRSIRAVPAAVRLRHLRLQVRLGGVEHKAGADANSSRVSPACMEGRVCQEYT